MVDFREFDQYLIKGEKVVYGAEPFRVNGEHDYTGAVTNKRVLFLRGSEIHEILGSSIASITWESTRNIVYLTAGMILIVLGIIMIYINGLFLTALGFGLVFVWYHTKRESMMLFSTGRQLEVRGSKHFLEKMMVEIRRELMK